MVIYQNKTERMIDLVAIRHARFLKNVLMTQYWAIKWQNLCAIRSYDVILEVLHLTCYSIICLFNVFLWVFSDFFWKSFSLLIQWMFWCQLLMTRPLFGGRRTPNFKYFYSDRDCICSLLQMTWSNENNILHATLWLHGSDVVINCTEAKHA